MKAKTKSQLEKEILTLQTMLDAMDVALEDAKKQLPGALGALGFALNNRLTCSPELWSEFALFLMVFLSELRRIIGMDFSSDDAIEFMGFDQVTAMGIREGIPFFEEVAKMVAKMLGESKTDEEIFEYLKKMKERRGDSPG